MALAQGNGENFTMRVVGDDDRPVVILEGEVDGAVRDIVTARLASVLAQGHQHVVIDLSKVDFMDSSGLHVLIWAHQVEELRGGRFEVRSPSTSIRKLFEIVGIADKLHITR